MPPTKKTPTATKTPAKPRTSTRRKKGFDSVSDLKPEQVMKEVGTLSVSLQEQLSGIGASITQKLEAMKNIDDVIADKKDELVELHEIEKEAQNLASVREMRSNEDDKWENMKENRLAEWQDDESEREKKWKREDEAHNYEHAQKVARDQQQSLSEKEEKLRGEKIRQEDLLRDWTSREEALTSQEQELGDLLTRVEQFEEETKREVSKAEAQATNRVKRDYEHQIQLNAKDSEAATKLAGEQQASLRNQITHLSEQLEDVQKQLEVARSDAKEVTSAALESASGRDSLSAVQASLANSGKGK